MAIPIAKYDFTNPAYRLPNGISDATGNGNTLTLSNHTYTKINDMEMIEFGASTWGRASNTLVPIGKEWSYHISFLPKPFTGDQYIIGDTVPGIMLILNDVTATHISVSVIDFPNGWNDPTDRISRITVPHFNKLVDIIVQHGPAKGSPLRLYINGLLVAETILTTSMGSNFKFGLGSPAHNNVRYRGYIKEITIYEGYLYPSKSLLISQGNLYSYNNNQPVIVGKVSDDTSKIRNTITESGTSMDTLLNILPFIKDGKFSIMTLDDK